MLTPILATLGYVLAPEADKVLMVHRNARPDDHHFGKYNGLGGKLHRDEDVLAGMKREIREEAGIECTSLWLRGTISWPGFGNRGQDWFGFVFLIDAWTGTPKATNPEGTLTWIDVDQILQLPLWEGDHYFLPLVFDDAIEQFHGVMPYKAGKPMSWTFTTVPRFVTEPEA